MAIVNEVITQFGFEGSSKPLTNYNAALGQSIALLGTGALAVGGLAVAFQAFVFQTTAALDPMIQLSRSTGVAVTTMQELGFAASVAGSDLSAVQSSVAGLSEKIGEAAQKGSEDFSRLGISVRDSNGEVKKADDVLAEVGTRFQQLGLSLDEQRSFASSLGIDPSLLQLMNKSGAEMDALRSKARALGVVTEEQADAAASLNDSMTTLKFGLGAVQNSIAIGFAPQLEDITNGFVDFLAANKDLIVEGISKTGEFITQLAAGIVRLAPVILGIAAAFGIAQIASLGFGTVMATVFSPVVLITAAIVAALFVIDDLIVAFNGGKSVIGDFFQEFFGIDIVPVLQGIVDAFGVMMDGIAAILNSIGSILGDVFSAAIALVTGDFDGFIDHIASAFMGVVDFFSTAFQPISDLINAAVGFSAGGLGSLFGFGDSQEQPATEQPAIEQLDIDQQRLSAGSGSQSSQTSSNTISQDVTIEIKTDDPKAAGSAVTDSLQEQLADAQTQFNRGGI